MSDIHKEFDEEKDLHSEFDKEQDLSKQIAPDEQLTTPQALAAGFGGSLLGKFGSALGAVPTSLVTGQSIPEAYQSLQAPAQQAFMQARAQSPVTTAVGQGIADIPALGAATAAAGPIGGAALFGGAQGASDTGTLSGAATGAALGGALGAGGELAGQAIKSSAQALAPKLESFANKQAVKSLLPTASQFSKIKDVQALGKFLLDQGIVSPFSSAETQLGRAADLAQEAGPQISNINSYLDSQGIKAFNPEDVANRIEEQIGNNYENEPLFKAQSDQYHDALNTILNRGDKPISFQDAQNLKNLFSEYAYNKGLPIESRQIAKQMGGIIGDELEQSVAQGAQQLNKPQLYKDYVNAKDQYGNASQAANILNKSSAKQAVANTIPTSLSDVTSIPNAVNKYGRNIAAALTNSGAKAAAKIGAGVEQIASGSGEMSRDFGQKLLDNGFKAMNDASPEQVQSIGETLSSNPATKYIGETIKKALDTGDRNTLNAGIFSILQSPAARRIIGSSPEDIQ